MSSLITAKQVLCVLSRAHFTTKYTIKRRPPQLMHLNKQKVKLTASFTDNVLNLGVIVVNRVPSDCEN